MKSIKFLVGLLSYFSLYLLIIISLGTMLSDDEPKERIDRCELRVHYNCD